MEQILGSEVMVPGIRLVVELESKCLIQMLNQEVSVDVAMDVYLQDIRKMASLF